jgi:hypothetical protein
MCPRRAGRRYHRDGGRRNHCDREPPGLCQRRTQAPPVRHTYEPFRGLPAPELDRDGSHPCSTVEVEQSAERRGHPMVPDVAGNALGRTPMLGFELDWLTASTGTARSRTYVISGGKRGASGSTPSVR